MNILLKNSARLLSANVIAQAIGLVVYPILTRLYSPEDFGLLNLVMSIGGILIIFSTAEYQNAIVLTKTDNQAKTLVILSGSILLGFVGLMILAAPFCDQIERLVGAEHLSQVYWFLPIYVFLLGAWNILNMYFTRKAQFATISEYKMGQSIVTAGGKLGFGYGGILHQGLLYATVIGPALSLVYTIARHRNVLHQLRQTERISLREVATTYRQFPLFSLPRALVNVLSTSLPALILVPQFGLSNLGYFSMALTLAFLPLSLIVNSIQQALYQQVASMTNEQQSIKGLLLRIHRITVMIVVPFFIGLYFILPWLTSWLLGDSYAISGEYIRWMLPWLLFTCLNGMICFVVDIFMQQRMGLLFECLILLLRVLGLGWGIYQGSFDDAIMAYCVMTTLALFIQLLWFYRLINRH